MDQEEKQQDSVNSTYPCQLEISFSGNVLKTLYFDQDLITIGRDAECDVVMDNLSISRVHAHILRVGRFYTIRDVGSKTGIFIQGKKVEEYNLNPGNEIFLGKHVITFQRASSSRWHQKESKKPPKTSKLTASARQQLMQTMQVDFSSLAKKQGPAPAYIHFIGTRQRIPVQKPVVFFGKSSNCDVTVTGLLIGKRHTLIVHEEKGFFIYQLGYFKPPRVNDQPVEFAMLQDGDLIQIGDLRFVFQIPEGQGA